MMDLYFSNAYKNKQADELKKEQSEDGQALQGVSIRQAFQKMRAFEEPGPVLKKNTDESLWGLLKQRASVAMQLENNDELTLENREQGLMQIDYINEQIKKLIIL